MPGVSSFNTRTGAVTLLNTDVDPLINSDFDVYALGGTHGGIGVQDHAGTKQCKVYHDGTSGVFTTTVGTAQLGDSSTPATLSTFWQTQTATGNLRAGNGNYQLDFTGDTGVRRVAAKVVGATDSGAGVGWFQNTAGTARVTADVTNATAVMANVADLSFPVQAGRHYVGEYLIFGADSTAVDGLQFDMNGGTATFTDLEFGFAAQPAGSTLGTVCSTAPGTPITLSAVSTADAVYTISFGFTANAAGTVVLRFAQVAHSTGTATVRKNGSLSAQDSPN